MQYDFMTYDLLPYFSLIWVIYDIEPGVCSKVQSALLCYIPYVCNIWSAALYTIPQNYINLEHYLFSYNVW